MSQAWIWQHLRPERCGQDTYLASLFYVPSPAMATLFLMTNRNKTPKEEQHLWSDVPRDKNST